MSHSLVKWILVWIIIIVMDICIIHSPCLLLCQRLLNAVKRNILSGYKSSAAFPINISFSFMAKDGQLKFRGCSFRLHKLQFKLIHWSKEVVSNFSGAVLSFCIHCQGVRNWIQIGSKGRRLIQKQKSFLWVFVYKITCFLCGQFHMGCISFVY